MHAFLFLYVVKIMLGNLFSKINFSITSFFRGPSRKEEGGKESTSMMTKRGGVKDNLWCMMTFGERQPSVEENLQWKTTCGGKATNKQGRRLKFGILTVVTNINSTKVL